MLRRVRARSVLPKAWDANHDPLLAAKAKHVNVIDNVIDDVL